MTKLVVAFLIIFKLTVSWAQGTGGGLSPAEMNEFKNNIAEMEAKKNEEQRKQQEQQKKFAFPPSSSVAAAAAAASMDPTTAPPPIVPASTELPAGVITDGDLRSATIVPPPQASSDQRVKSPFMIPNELYIKIKKKIGEKPNTIDIDEAVEVRLRWPLKEYKLVGVIYDTRKPKAMIADREGKVHVYREKELIANGGGYVAEINNGEVIVVEKGAEVRLQLKDR